MGAYLKNEYRHKYPDPQREYSGATSYIRIFILVDSPVATPQFLGHSSDTHMPITALGVHFDSALVYERVRLISGYTQTEKSNHQFYSDELAYSTLISMSLGAWAQGFRLENTYLTFLIDTI